ncbi:MAG: glycosyltransferase family 39 protein [Saprospiraceae bacterium]|nr:glycosyltransferase family 39 protein [Saprospiraceae bacterium]
MIPTFYLPALACLLAVLSLFFHQYRTRPKAAIGCLFAGALLLRWWMATLDPYLHDWDERFHALVASNMMQEPFRPMLYTHPPEGYNYQLWSHNHIWLHKPPLFLWQIALSMRVFGTEIWSMRLPSVLMGALLVFPIFRMGALLHQASTGFYAALLFTFAFNHLDMVSGNEGMDHNDVAFMFYVTLSIWAYFEYRQSDRAVRWAIGAGLFAGAAVLCKWLAGTLVLAVWGLQLLVQAIQTGRGHWRHWLLACAVAAAVFLPWQAYCFWKFPREAAFEQAYNFRHLTEVIEQHGGTWYYYFGLINFHFSGGTWLLILAGIWLSFSHPVQPLLRNALLLSIGLVYAFFSLVAATKMPSYTYFIAPAAYVLMGLAISVLERFICGVAEHSAPKIFIAIVAAGLCYLCLFPAQIDKRHFNISDFDRSVRERKLNNTRIYRRLDEWTPDSCIVYNCPGELEAMFFSDRVVYSTIPNAAEYEALQKRGVPMAIFDDPDAADIPSFILENDKGVIFLKDELLREK